MIQNQVGRHPNKWDKSGVVVETKDNDQYVVKVAGSRRLTLRNRRFLRKYEPHYKQAPEMRVGHSNHSGIHTPDSNTLQPPVSAETGMIKAPQVSPLPATGGTQQSLLTNPAQQTPSPLLPAGTGTDKTEHSSPCYAPQQPPALQDGLRTHVAPAASTITTRRSTRERKQRQLYDASTGQYAAPHGVTFK